VVNELKEYFKSEDWKFLIWNCVKLGAVLGVVAGFIVGAALIRNM